MGNSNNSEKHNENESLMRNRAPGGGSCFACIQGPEHSFDMNEFNLIRNLNQPKGKISTNSIAYLTKDEINFFKAAAGRNVSAIRFYLKREVNVNILDEDRTSPLHVAARQGSIQVVEELLNQGAAVDITDFDGWTPLHVAVHYQRPIICHILLKKGANPLIKNRQGLSPIEMIEGKKIQEIFDKIIESNSQTQKNSMNNGTKKYVTGEFDSEGKFESPRNIPSNSRQTFRRNQSESNLENFSLINNKLRTVQINPTSAATNEGPFQIPNMLSPRKHKYYLYFKSLKKSKSSQNQVPKQGDQDMQSCSFISMNSLLNESICSNYGDLESRYEVEKILERTDQKSGFPIEESFIKEESSLDISQEPKKMSVGNVNSGIGLNGKENKMNSNQLKTSGASIGNSMSKKKKFTSQGSIKKKGEENIDFPDETASESFKRIKALIHINQSIPFKLKNTYCSSLEAKKDLDFKVNSKSFNFDNRSPLKTTKLHLASGEVLNNQPSLISRPNAASLITRKPSYLGPESAQSILFVDNKVISVRGFVSDETEKFKEYLENDNDEGKSNAINKTLQIIHSERKNNKKLIEIGFELFNHNALHGISYLIFLGCLQPTPAEIANFLHYDDKLQKFINKGLGHNQMIIKNKGQVGKLLTDLRVKEILEILKDYFDVYKFKGMSFVSALRFFLKQIELENEPEKIDLILYFFSRKYFRDLKQESIHFSEDVSQRSDFFQNYDSVHMLAFATIMLDIEIHICKRPDLENVIREFQLNVVGLNDGENFPKDFIMSIIEKVLESPIIFISSSQKLLIKSAKVRAKVLESSELCIAVRKNSKQDVLQIIILGGLAFIFNNSDETPKSLFLFNNCAIKVNGPQILFQFQKKKAEEPGIIYVKYRKSGTLQLKYKESLEFNLMETKNSEKIMQFLSKISKN